MDILDLFDKNYTILFHGHYGRGKKRYVGPEKPNRCRFCGRSRPDVTFRNKGHAIPEFLGNRQLLVRDECDSCNQFFSSALEDHLDKFTRPYRVTGQIKGKTKIPSYKSPLKKSRLDTAREGMMITEYADDPFIRIDENEKELTLAFSVESHIPCAVYKALVKIALSVMPPQQLSQCDACRRWILCEDHSRVLLNPLKVLFTWVPGPNPFRETSVFLLWRKDCSCVSYPSCLFTIAFGNIQLQIIVPTALATGVVRIPRFPTPFEKSHEYGPPAYGTLDLSVTELISAHMEAITMHYERALQ